MSLKQIVIDPRHSQIAILVSLLAIGTLTQRIAIPWLQPMVILGGVLVTQMVACRVIKIPFDWRSPLISGLSLTLLLRVDSLWWALAAAVIAIAAKFLIRVNGKHLFNPTNGAIVALLLLTDSAWVSPGQWGSYLWLFLLLCCCSQLVLHKAARSVLGIGFLFFYAGLLLGRAYWLGDPWQVPLHGLHSGALLIFAFFMISDPKSTPDSLVGQAGFALMTAIIALWFHFGLYNFNSLFYALALTSITTPLWDKYFPAKVYQWPTKQEAQSCA